MFKLYIYTNVMLPGMDQAIEKYVQRCKICQAVQPSAQPVPLHPWSATKTIEKIRGAFAAYGVPETLVSDNGPQFTSVEFADFLTANGVKHVRIPPYHAASNGAAERMVQTIKRALLKQVLEENALDSRSSFQERVDKFLCAYRNTPSSVTGHSPAQLFLKRQPRTKLSLLKPDFGHAMRDKQEHVKEECDKGHGEERVFRVGDRVYVKTVRGEHVSWQEAVVTQVVSAVTYVVKVHNQFRFVHADHLRSQHADTARACDMERPEIRIRPPEHPPPAPPVPLSPDHATADPSPPVPRTPESEPTLLQSKPQRLLRLRHTST